MNSAYNTIESLLKEKQFCNGVNIPKLENKILTFQYYQQKPFTVFATGTIKTTCIDARTGELQHEIQVIQEGRCTYISLHHIVKLEEKY